MANSTNSLTICSFNCKNVKTSLVEIIDLCLSFDIILLQETWLLDFELPLLNNVHPDFYARGISSVKSNDGLLVGRPHGGLAILWRKSMGSDCTVVDYCDDRLMGLEISSHSSKVLLVNVYLPYCCNDNIDDYMFYLCKLDSIIESADTPYVFVVGDFNANVSLNDNVLSHKFGQMLVDYTSEHRLHISDKMLCDKDTYTFYSSASISWLDHIVSTMMAHSIINDVRVLYDFITSDHHPIVFKIDMSLFLKSDTTSMNVDSNTIVWSGVSLEDKAKYRCNTRNNLERIVIPQLPISCTDSKCQNAEHIKLLTDFYDDITNALFMSSTFLVR